MLSLKKANKQWCNNSKTSVLALILATMYCERCGTQLPDEAAFCFSCSKPTSNAPKQIPAATPQRHTSKTPWVILAVLLACVIIGLAVRLTTDKPKAPAEVISLPAPVLQRPPLPMPPVPFYHDKKLFSGSIAVNAHSMYWVTFTLTPSMQKIRVTGHFQTYGGRQNDIQAVICSDEDFINFRNGHQAQVVYDSGKTTVGDINTTIPDGGGKYVLAFNNSFSMLSGKTVNGEVTLGYEILGQP